LRSRSRLGLARLAFFNNSVRWKGHFSIILPPDWVGRSREIHLAAQGFRS
jgi:hypothetical protein